MTLRNNVLAKRNVTLCANKGRVGFLLINLEIQRPTIVGRRRNMTPFRSTA
jgi:hypothetical protein